MNYFNIVPLEERIVLDAAAVAMIYVSISAPSGGNGTLAHPFHSLQDALTYAGTLSGAKQIDVAQGTYLPTSGTDRTATFSIPNSTTIVGGFNSTFTKQNASQYPTILSGNIGQQSVNTDNSLTVVTVAGGGSVTLSGLTVTQGYNDSGNGAGIVELNGSSLTLSGVTVSNNVDTVGEGAGIYALNDAVLNVSNSSFLSNSVLFLPTPRGASGPGEGGGIFTYGVTTVTVDHSLFQNNTTNNAASAIWAEAAQMTTLTNDTFINDSNLAVVLQVDNAGNALVQSNLFTNNISTLNIGTLDVNSANQATVIGNTFTNNQVLDLTPGGNNGQTNDQVLLTIFNGNLIFENNIISNNTVVGNFRPAIYASSFELGTISGNIFSNNVIKGTAAGGALSTAFDGDLSITNNIFSNNVSAGGAAIQMSQNGLYSGFIGQNVTISQNTFSNNVSTQGGGAIELDQVGIVAPFTITQNIFSGNKAAGDGGAIYVNGASSVQLGSNIFSGNSAASGGAVYDSSPGEVLAVTSNIFSHDTAHQGSEMWLSGDQASVNGVSPATPSLLLSKLITSNLGLLSNEIYLG